jgi:hypothetical protein
VSPARGSSSSGGATNPTIGTAKDPHGNVSGPDYAALSDCAKKLKGKNPAYAQEHEVQITADWAIPYQTVINTMDALRGNPPVVGAPPNDKTPVCDIKNSCLFDKVVFSAPAGK